MRDRPTPASTTEPVPEAPDARDRWLSRRLEDGMPLRAEVLTSLEAFWHEAGGRWPVRLCYERATPGAALQAAALPAGEPDGAVPPWPRGEPLTRTAARAGAALILPDRPVPLEPVTVPKPWGREIWFTGMERRGVAGAAGNAPAREEERGAGGTGGRTPLPFLLALAPGRFADGAPDRLNLLKVLDPHPDPELGDLYFELHRHKREVYVVAAVDRDAWPDGTGAIRFGFDPQRRAAYRDRDAFLRAYGGAVAAYRTAREAVDARLDARRHGAGLPADAPLAPEVQARWLAELPRDLRAEEARLREAMHAFTRRVPLAVGDVVRVPPLTPHALQHGVRVVEFQTPVYERLILSFGQKVLTQGHWDTEEALELLARQGPGAAGEADDAEGAFLRTRAGGAGRERVARFDHFDVWREGPGPAEAPPAPGVRVAYLLRGRSSAAGRPVRPGEAWLFPAGSATPEDGDPEALWLYACAPPEHAGAAPPRPGT